MLWRGKYVNAAISVKAVKLGVLAFGGCGVDVCTNDKQRFSL